MTEEGLNFTRSGVKKIYEKMKAGTMTEEDFHRAAANTEAMLREDDGMDIKVKYMGTLESKLAERGIDLVKDFMTYTMTLPEWRSNPRQTKLFEEE